MDAERVLNGCSILASSIVTLTKSRYLLKKFCDGLVSSKFSAKITLFFHISKFFATKISKSVQNFPFIRDNYYNIVLRYWGARSHKAMQTTLTYDEL